MTAAQRFGLCELGLNLKRKESVRGQRLLCSISPGTWHCSGKVPAAFAAVELQVCCRVQLWGEHHVCVYLIKVMIKEV